MLNVFFKNNIAIPLVITFVIPAALLACRYTVSDVMRNYQGSIETLIKAVDNWYKDEYSHCCTSDEDERPTFNHQCNNSTNNCTKLNCYNPELIFQCSNSEDLCQLNCLLHCQTQQIKKKRNLTNVLDNIISHTGRFLCCKIMHKNKNKKNKNKQNKKRLQDYTEETRRRGSPKNTKKEKHHVGQHKCSQRICEVKETFSNLKTNWKKFAQNAPDQCK
ncbi:uncharacterized protein LOC134607809 [Pelobates fuscus]|uniref:uncharacterized protein LOC134607809 n=1 Tax=Pelobates fuscus TaxID=191477 RepID=UPI002FE4A056